MTWAPCPHGVRTRGKKHNAFFMCDKFEKPHWLELLPAEGPDSDAFDEELSHEYCQYHASPW